MMKPIYRLLFALFVLGSIAGLSAQASLDQDLQDIHARWQHARTLDAEARGKHLSELRRRVADLRQRYPERRDLVHWERIIHAERQPYG
ncbi:hypothetical protein [Alkalilimnicola sp. S0819]|uniref:hypothetical protein n=1 Tax=Alkalilimnicola sp. S0819 TaxID=2613922 RepID=UPI001261883B|nr:hypothetical protein [Alkalilimnicola sp. S0819]KAB7622755.1 hypothetical protein F3N43_11445 [Alkalilimnicola sp. S0819]MPQ17248.1 hypothetical protein [Alkalilimnicola sp. S0819]